MSDWNAQLIATLRANNGEVPEGPMAGRPLMVLTSKGAKTGEARQAVLTYSRDDGRYVVCATAGGSPVTPSWYHNLVANPAVQVEAKGSEQPAVGKDWNKESGLTKEQAEKGQGAPA